MYFRPSLFRNEHFDNTTSSKEFLVLNGTAWLGLTPEQAEELRKLIDRAYIHARNSIFGVIIDGRVSSNADLPGQKVVSIYRQGQQIHAPRVILFNKTNPLVGSGWPKDMPTPKIVAALLVDRPELAFAIDYIRKAEDGTVSYVNSSLAVIEDADSPEAAPFIPYKEHLLDTLVKDISEALRAVIAIPLPR